MAEVPAVSPLETQQPNPDNLEHQERVIIPGNLFVMATHGTARIPGKYFEGKGAGKLSRHFTIGEDGELSLYAKDGSDYATGAIAGYIREQNQDAAVNPPIAGRMLVDPNRSRDKAKKRRSETFGGAPIYDEPPSLEARERLAEEVWDTFHDRAQVGVETVALESDPNDHTLIVDIHDTDEIKIDAEGNHILRVLKNGETGFPLLIVSDRNSQASHPEVRKILGYTLLEELVTADLIEVEWVQDEGLQENFEYEGGYTTERYGIDLPNAYLLRGDEDLQAKAQHLHFVQIELNRTMYISPDRTGLDEERLARTQVAVARALTRTAETIRDLELGDWRTAPEKGSLELWRAMDMPLLAATDWYRRAKPTSQAIVSER